MISEQKLPELGTHKEIERRPKFGLQTQSLQLPSLSLKLAKQAQPAKNRSRRFCTNCLGGFRSSQTSWKCSARAVTKDRTSHGSQRSFGSTALVGLRPTRTRLKNLVLGQATHQHITVEQEFFTLETPHAHVPQDLTSRAQQDLHAKTRHQKEQNDPATLLAFPE